MSILEELEFEWDEDKNQKNLEKHETRTVTLNKDQKLTEEQILEIEAARNKPIIFDEDSPELTPAMEKAFTLAAKSRNRVRNIS